MTESSNIQVRIQMLARGADFGWVVDILTARRDEILARWLAAMSVQPFHGGRNARAVTHHVPRLLDAIVDLLRRAAPRTVEAPAPLNDPAVLDAAAAHARERFDQGLASADIVTEFRLLRQEIGRSVRLSVDDRTPAADIVAAELLVHDALDGAIALALDALTHHIEEVREDFLATTVHDVQQPLTAITGNIQLARRSLTRPGHDPVRVAETLGRADAEAARMRGLLATLTDASRVALGRLELRRHALDLGKLVRETVGRLDPDTAARVRLDLAPPDETTGTWDPDLLERVVVNLLSNAAKYSPPDQPIFVVVRGEADDVLLTVRDCGIGLTAEDIAGLFQRYARASRATARGIEGAGLGLYLSRSIVEAHGGRIWATSPGPGQGTTMHLLLPRAVPAAIAAP